MSLPTHEEHQQAKEALEFIRHTMENASSYTAVSGWGLVGVGLVGLAAAAVAARLGQPAALQVWVPAATLAIAVQAVANAGKAKRLSVPLWSGAFRKLAWVMAPVLVAGAVLTYALAEAGVPSLLPGTWLALYGAGVTAGGTLSVRAIRGMGLLLLTLGAVALLRPALGAPFLAAGFGAVHLAFGMLVISRHGG
ncbi:MAG TPA: hypothetical protein VFH97_10625 [Gemmatimonadales bacterium]|nr:hypothetical protein [Gemmatimonadales bacterium]